MEAELSFLIPDAKIAFNRLRLAFIKALIFQHFDLECYIWIETYALDFAIGEVLSKLIFRISPDEVITKADVG